MGPQLTLISPSTLTRLISSTFRHHRRSPFLINPSTVDPIESRRQIASAVKAESKSKRMDEASGSGGHGKKSSGNSNGNNRVPLAEVVSDCVKRWFQDTLKEAKAGDSAMQVLVGQMYFNGYGVTKDINKGRAWINKASKVRSAVWKVSEKRPGYNASDSDSDIIADAE